ncbi:MAG: methyltransferase domain-containing protein [Planctomycetaceae bacterium]|nr:methyltransferase domain-containing protein [Planctomycetaceae bacterium]
MTTDHQSRVSEQFTRIKPLRRTLQIRNRQPEVMDEPELDGGLHVAALDSLGRINRLSRTTAGLWGPICNLARESLGQGSLRILDIASGGGDVALGLARRAAKAGIAVEIEGVDISPRAVYYANAAAARQQLTNVAFHARDVLAEPIPHDIYDVITCSLFLHHLDESDAFHLLGNMAGAARRLVVVSDLRRTRLGYFLACLVSRTLVWSPVVRVDGPLSVAAAFTMDEARELARKSGLGGAVISHQWPQRFLLTWRRV